MHAAPCITVSCMHDLTRVMAMAASLRVNCTMVSPPGAGCVMGVPWWTALVADCPLPALLDCGQAAGYAACALRAGVCGVIAHVSVAQHRALVSLAQVTGGHVMERRPASLDLPPRDAGPVLERYLRRFAAG
ncbi:hypothetical protein [Komagataeibacter sp. FXV3]|uniref:hypothetical protein n=1 Tax=Komagataeibacter sp. FXV3 TaxID=2608998 RepID=UPI00187B7649|nr:hypothetical protein [Komagataeibacter sp. FXV3]